MAEFLKRTDNIGKELDTLMKEYIDDLEKILNTDKFDEKKEYTNEELEIHVSMSKIKIMNLEYQIDDAKCKIREPLINKKKQSRNKAL